MPTRTKTILQSALLLQTSGLPGVTPYVQKPRTSSDKCVWSFPNSDTTSLVSLCLTNKIISTYTNYSNSPCPGRETQAREARQDAPLHPHTRQFPKTCSGYIDSCQGEQFAGVWGFSRFRFELSLHLYNISNVSLLWKGGHNQSQVYQQKSSCILAVKFKNMGNHTQGTFEFSCHFCRIGLCYHFDLITRKQKGIQVTPFSGNISLSDDPQKQSTEKPSIISSVIQLQTPPRKCQGISSNVQSQFHQYTRKKDLRVHRRELVSTWSGWSVASSLKLGLLLLWISWDLCSMGSSWKSTIDRVVE